MYILFFIIINSYFVFPAFAVRARPNNYKRYANRNRLTE